MPAQHGVHILEQAGANHVQLAVAAFLGGRAVEADGAGDLVGGEPLLDGDGGKQRRGAEQVVTTAMSGTARDERLALRRGVLGETGQGIVLAHDADHGLALAPGGGERRRHAGQILGDGESRRVQFALEERGALVFLEAKLGELPNFARDVTVVGGARVHGLQDGALVVSQQGDGGEEEKENGTHKDEDSGNRSRPGGYPGHGSDRWSLSKSSRGKARAWCNLSLRAYS